LLVGELHARRWRVSDPSGLRARLGLDDCGGYRADLATKPFRVALTRRMIHPPSGPLAPGEGGLLLRMEPDQVRIAGVRLSMWLPS
jgi:hypothetical protein